MDHCVYLFEFGSISNKYLNYGWIMDRRQSESNHVIHISHFRPSMVSVEVEPLLRSSLLFLRVEQLLLLLRPRHELAKGRLHYSMDRSGQ